MSKRLVAPSPKRSRTTRPHAIPMYGVLCLLAACAPGNGDPDATSDTTGVSAVTPDASEPDTVYSAQMSATQGQEGVEGRLTLVREGDEPIELNLRGSGLPPGEHAWHIHEGACGSSGPVRIALSETAEMEGLAESLDVDGDGAFEESVNVPALTPDLIGRGGHSLHIHQRGGTDHGGTIACVTI